MNESERTFYTRKFETFERDVIGPAVFDHLAPLKVAIAEADGAIDPEQAPGLAYRDVEIGHRWGPPWARVWFRLRGSLGTGVPSDSTVLRFDPGTEALIYEGREPWQGLDANRAEARLPASSLRSDGSVEVYIEAECMHPWGVRAFSWDSTETHKRWGSRDPGHVTLAELARFDERVWGLLSAYRFARQYFDQLDPGDPLMSQLVETLVNATHLIDDRNVSATAARARERLMQFLARGADPGSARVLAAGHAHIDTAWLWTLDQTRRKCLRSWSNVVRLTERNGCFPFLCSQAAQYQMVAEDAPGLLADIRRLVREGHWELLGAMWVEPDCNVPSGESLIRQVIEGVRTWRELIGPDLDHRTAFLPDTFGFPVSLPGILRACGIDVFITNKMSWNQTNQMPYTNFVWRGLGGAEVLVHLTPGGDYNASNTPKEILRGKARASSAPPSSLWFQPFGFGDGGGGPTDWQIENARLAARCPGLPAFEFGSALQFTELLREDHGRASASETPWPVWEGELYLELHRGTLTTQSKLKQMHTRAEHALREAEIAQAFGRLSSDESLRPHWRVLLTNEFHDILPGSSIREVNVQAEQELASVCEAANRSFELGLLGDSRDTGYVWNPASSSASGVVDGPQGPVYVHNIPALTSLPVVHFEPDSFVTGDEHSLSNGLLEAHLNSNGSIASFARAGQTPVGDEPIHSYHLYRDRPHMWDAWDIDPGYERDEVEICQQATFEITEDHPLRRAIRVHRRLTDRASVITTYTLTAGSPVLEVVMEIDWQEDHRLLRVLYPTGIHASEATYGIQFGSINRSTESESSWDRAKFECAVHRYLDLSERGRGLTVLTPSTYGASARGSTLGLSLLRSPTHPDPLADRGIHRIRLGLTAHGGDMWAARIPALAEQFARPMRCVESGIETGGFGFECEGGAEVELTALKHAESDGAIIARFVEIHGQPGTLGIRWPENVDRIEITDAIESRVMGVIEREDQIPLAANQILTIRAWRR